MSITEQLCKEIASRKPRVLLVEDSNDDVILAMMIFKGLGCDLDTAYDGGQAVRMVESEKPYDMIFVDMKLPVVSGLEVLKFIKKNTPDVPVIIVTAFLDSIALAHAADMGYVSVVTKPLSETTVMGIFANHKIRLPQPCEETQKS